MNREIAEKTLSVVIQSNFILDAYLHDLRERVDPEEFKEYCKKFGKIMGEAFCEVLAPLWAQYPDLLPEKMGGPYQTNDEHYKNIYKLVMVQAGLSKMKDEDDERNE